MKLILLLRILLLVVITSCGNLNTKIERLSWLKGTWANNTAQGLLFEHWRQADDSTLYGTSYFLNNNDTVLFERVRLVQRNEHLLYIVTGADPKNNGPVEFRESKFETNQFRVENPAHDFPQVIHYQQISADSLLAYISLLTGEKKQLFPMKKIN